VPNLCLRMVPNGRALVCRTNKFVISYTHSHRSMEGTLTRLCLAGESDCAKEEGGSPASPHLPGKIEFAKSPDSFRGRGRSDRRFQALGPRLSLFRQQDAAQWSLEGGTRLQKQFFSMQNIDELLVLLEMNITRMTWREAAIAMHRLNMLARSPSPPKTCLHEAHLHPNQTATTTTPTSPQRVQRGIQALSDLIAQELYSAIKSQQHGPSASTTATKVGVNRKDASMEQTVDVRSSRRRRRHASSNRTSRSANSSRTGAGGSSGVVEAWDERTDERGGSERGERGEESGGESGEVRGVGRGSEDGRLLSVALSAAEGYDGTQFNCFTSSKIQILTQETLLGAHTLLQASFSLLCTEKFPRLLFSRGVTGRVEEGALGGLGMKEEHGREVREVEVKGREREEEGAGGRERGGEGEGEGARGRGGEGEGERGSKPSGVDIESVSNVIGLMSRQIQVLAKDTSLRAGAGVEGGRLGEGGGGGGGGAAGESRQLLFMTRIGELVLESRMEEVSIRQRMPAYVCIRQHTSAYVCYLWRE
jgi:hypothetical protein